MTTDQKVAAETIRGIANKFGCRETARKLDLSPMFISCIVRGLRAPGVKAMAALKKIAVCEPPSAGTS